MRCIPTILALLAATLVSPVALGHGDSLGISPHLDWMSIESKHFRVTYPKELETVARRTTAYLEEAHALMHQILRWEPGARTSVILLDNEDSANGLASANLRFGMVLYATPPDNWFSIGHYDDWLRMLAIHEYTHFLNLDPIKDFHWIFWLLTGDAYRPNSYWTRWMTEGLAVYMETALTSGGRGRSPFYEMILRAAVQENLLDHSEFMTLDKIDGPNPYFPRGETPYLFGYQLYSQMMRDPENRERMNTYDGRDAFENPQELLGVISERSSGRVPFFINGNLENITGKEWTQYWSEWVDQTRERMKSQLAAIASQPVTEPEWIERGPNETLGPELSLDGKWLAYSQNSSHRRAGLFIRKVGGEESLRIIDKHLGAKHSFTPDSKLLLFSAQRQYGNYRRTSELGAYDLHSGNLTWLTSGARFKDPDVSPDGKRVVFAWAKNGGVGIGEAELNRDEDGLSLGKPKSLYFGELLDRAAQPVYTPDGRSIVFSLQKNGTAGENLWVLDRHSGQIRALTRGTANNRFPVHDAQGTLHFVSDRTGVENLFRMSSGGTPIQVSNIRTGIRFPTFAKDGTVYASVFDPRGWQLAKLRLAESIDSSKVTVSAPEPPKPEQKSSPPRPDEAKLLPQSYSIWPSLPPRAWSPFLLFDGASLVFGGTIQGFDTLDLHRYALGAIWYSSVDTVDWSVGYANRTLGPTLSVFASNVLTAASFSNGELTDYRARLRAQVELTQPVLFDWSALEASLSWSIDRSTTHTDVGGIEGISKSSYVPTASAEIIYSDAEASALAVAPERGQQLRASARSYFNSGETTFKGLLSAKKYLSLIDHWSLIPSVSYSWISKRSSYIDANVLVTNRGDSPLSLMDPTVDLDEITIRGYPGLSFITRAFALPALDLRIPLWRVYRGLSTHPFFLKNFHLVGFAEAGYIPSAELFLPSVGGGLRVESIVLVHFPLNLALEYHQGLKSSLGGTGELLFTVGTTLFP